MEAGTCSEEVERFRLPDLQLPAARRDRNLRVVSGARALPGLAGGLLPRDEEAEAPRKPTVHTAYREAAESGIIPRPLQNDLQFEEFGDTATSVAANPDATTISIEDAHETPKLHPGPPGGSRREEDDELLGNDDSDKTELLAGQKKSSPFWTFEYYQTFFDVDTYQVFDRIKGSLLPIPGKNFVRLYIRSNPDLYGPFWICATLVFAIAISGNLSNFLIHLGEKTYHYVPEFRKVSIAATVIYAYAWLVPLTLWGFLIWRNSKVMNIVSYSFLEIVCVYGYSLFIYIPTAILWIIPQKAVRWILVTIALGISGSLCCFTRCFLWAAWHTFLIHQRWTISQQLQLLQTKQLQQQSSAKEEFSIFWVCCFWTWHPLQGCRMTKASRKWMERHQPQHLEGLPWSPTTSPTSKIKCCVLKAAGNLIKCASCWGVGVKMDIRIFHLVRSFLSISETAKDTFELKRLITQIKEDAHKFRLHLVAAAEQLLVSASPGQPPLLCTTWRVSAGLCSSHRF
ncbi:Protein YIPF1 [Manis javanica]|nr:Protein YIPF1 [Manis javanica]